MKIIDAINRGTPGEVTEALTTMASQIVVALKEGRMELPSEGYIIQEDDMGWSLWIAVACGFTVITSDGRVLQAENSTVDIESLSESQESFQRLIGYSLLSYLREAHLLVE